MHMILKSLSISVINLFIMMTLILSPIPFSEISQARAADDQGCEENKNADGSAGIYKVGCEFSKDLSETDVKNHYPDGIAGIVEQFVGVAFAMIGVGLFWAPNVHSVNSCTMGATMGGATTFPIVQAGTLAYLLGELKANDSFRKASKEAVDKNFQTKQMDDDANNKQLASYDALIDVYEKQAKGLKFKKDMAMLAEVAFLSATVMEYLDNKKISGYCEAQINALTTAYSAQLEVLKATATGAVYTSTQTACAEEDLALTSVGNPAVCSPALIDLQNIGVLYLESYTARDQAAAAKESKDDQKKSSTLGESLDGVIGFITSIPGKIGNALWPESTDDLPTKRAAQVIEEAQGNIALTKNAIVAREELSAMLSLAIAEAEASTSFVASSYGTALKKLTESIDALRLNQIQCCGNYATAAATVTAETVSIAPVVQSAPPTENQTKKDDESPASNDAPIDQSSELAESNEALATSNAELAASQEALEASKLEAQQLAADNAKALEEQTQLAADNAKALEMQKQKTDCMNGTGDNIDKTGFFTKFGDGGCQSVSVSSLKAKEGWFAGDEMITSTSYAWCDRDSCQKSSFVRSDRKDAKHLNKFLKPAIENFVHRIVFEKMHKEHKNPVKQLKNLAQVGLYTEYILTNGQQTWEESNLKKELAEYKIKYQNDPKSYEQKLGTIIAQLKNQLTVASAEANAWKDLLGLGVKAFILYMVMWDWMEVHALAYPEARMYTWGAMAIVNLAVYTFDSKSHKEAEKRAKTVKLEKERFMKSHGILAQVEEGGDGSGSGSNGNNGNSNFIGSDNGSSGGGPATMTCAVPNGNSFLPAACPAPGPQSGLRIPTVTTDSNGRQVTGTLNTGLAAIGTATQELGSNENVDGNKAYQASIKTLENVSPALRRISSQIIAEADAKGSALRKATGAKPFSLKGALGKASTLFSGGSGSSGISSSDLNSGSKNLEKTAKKLSKRQGRKSKARNFTMPSFNNSSPGSSNLGFSDSEMESTRQNVMSNLDMNQESISENKDGDIFKMITNRYLINYPTMLNEKKKDSPKDK